MKFSMLLVALLSVTSLLGAEQFKTVETKELEQNKVELAQAKQDMQEAKQDAQQAVDDAAKAKQDAQTAMNEAQKAKDELAQMKSDIVEDEKEKVLAKNKTIHISVTGQGVAPMNTTSPAQAYALAKRAAIADAYRSIAEKVKGVRIDGQDLIKNMMVKRSVIRTSVQAMVRNANVVETTFKEGLCEVEMEIVISYSDFAQ